MWLWEEAIPALTYFDIFLSSSFVFFSFSFFHLSFSSSSSTSFLSEVFLSSSCWTGFNFHLKAKILEPPLSTAMITNIYCMCTYVKTELYVHLMLHGAYYCSHFIEHKVKAIEFKQFTQDHSAGGNGRVRSQTQIFLTPQLTHTLTLLIRDKE